MAAKSAAQLVQEARASIENLTPDQVEAELAQGAVLVDVREDSERDQIGYIAGAVHVARGVLEFQADPASPAHKPELDPARRVILHCASGGRSALGVVALRQLGYTNAAHLGGGFKAWMDAGKPVVKGG